MIRVQKLFGKSRAPKVYDDLLQGVPELALFSAPPDSRKIRTGWCGEVQYQHHLACQGRAVQVRGRFCAGDTQPDGVGMSLREPRKTRA